MTIEQVTFLGASITNFSCTVGWNGTESKLEVSLVEDRSNGDAFMPPDVGTPVYFNYEGFKFGGLLHNISESDSAGGAPLYTVSVVDPRVLLSGVQVILGEFSEPVLGIPNIINVFGWYESQGFGLSGSNGSGMSWDKIRDAINSILNIGNTGVYSYGTAIQYKGNQFGIDISNLPNLPSWFRISGTLSLMELIQQVCDAGGCDFFVTLEGSTITFHTISRINVPDTGTIPKFISQTPGAVSKNIGIDMVNEPCGKFVVGGKKRDILFQNTSYGADGVLDTGIDNPVWFHWGFDANENAIVANGVTNALGRDEHIFTLDTRNVLINGLGPTYQTSMGEMLAVLISESAWRNFLHMKNNFRYCSAPDNGTQIGYWEPISQIDVKFAAKNMSKVKYRHNGIPSPHFGKENMLGIASNVNPNLAGLLTQDSIDKAMPDWKKFTFIAPGKLDDSLQKLYGFLKSVAEENYGKKFMVQIPAMKAAYNAETNRPIFNMLPINGGYLDESVLETAGVNRLIPADLNRITNAEDNTFKPFVRFDNIGMLDFSEINEENILYSLDRRSIFIECSIEGDPFFLDWQHLTEARVVVVIPGKVKFANFKTYGIGLLANFLSNSLQDPSTPNAQKRQLEDGLDIINRGNQENYPYSSLPSMVALPLESQVSRYGPWWAVGKVGAMEYELDESLTPWNYGTYSNLQEAGNAKVTTNIANLQAIDSGSIEFPGAPTNNLGDQLLSTGPYISNIQVSCGSDGVKTIYRMEMWKPKFGTLNRNWAETVQKMGKLYNQYRRNFLEQIKLSTLRKQ